MTHNELQVALGELLEVDEFRYALAIRTQHLNQAIRGLELDLDAPYGQTQNTLQTVVDQRQYDPSTDFDDLTLPQFSHPVGIYYLNSEGTETEVKHLTYEEYRATYPLGTESDAPQHYTIWGGKIHLGPPPDAVYELTVDYYGYQQPLAAAGDENQWTIHAPWLVIYRAMLKSVVHLEEDERLPGVREMGDEEFSRLVIHLSQLEQSGRRPESEEY